MKILFMQYQLFINQVMNYKKIGYMIEFNIPTFEQIRK